MATIQDLGKVAYFNKGAYDSETTYEINDVVSYQGSSYVSLVNDNKDNIPTDTNFWSVVAQSAYEIAVQNGYEGTAEEWTQQFLNADNYYNKAEINTKNNNLQSQINSLASGSPLVANSTSEMTDTTKVYVNTTDGHWYYYNGTTWTDGGIYQSTGIADNSAKKPILELTVKEEYDGVNGIINSYPDVLKENNTYIPIFENISIDNTGAITQSSRRLTTNYIPVGRGIVFTPPTTNDYRCWARGFDDKYEYVDSFYWDSIGEVHVGSVAYGYTINIDKVKEINDNIKYIRLVFRNSSDTAISSIDYSYSIKKIKNINLDNIFEKLPLSMKVDLELGAIKSATGIDNAVFFDNYVRSKFYYEVIPNSTLTFSVSGNNLHVYMYNENFEFERIKSSQSSVAIDSDIKYVRFGINELSVENAKSLTNNSIVINGIVKEIKRNYTINENMNDCQRLWFNIKGTNYKSSCLFKLPSNYNPIGKPIPLIIFVHGSEDYYTISTQTMTNHYNDLYNYLRDNGYAIWDCFGWGDKYSSMCNTYGTPLNINTYCSGIEYFTKLFNIDTNNIYMIGKSLGGIQELAMMYQSRVKIKAVGFLAPALSSFQQDFGYTTAERNAIATEMGYSEPPAGLFDNTITIPVNASYRFYLENNIEHLLVNEPIWKGLLLDKDDKFTDLFLNRIGTTDYSNVLRINPNNIPCKFWFAMDDRNINPNEIIGLNQTLQNTGIISTTKIFANGTGGHHCVDTDENAPTVSNVTTPLGITYESVPQAYYEFIQFISQQ